LSLDTVQTHMVTCYFLNWVCISYWPHAIFCILYHCWYIRKNPHYTDCLWQKQSCIQI